MLFCNRALNRPRVFSRLFLAAVRRERRQRTAGMCGRIYWWGLFVFPELLRPWLGEMALEGLRSMMMGNLRQTEKKYICKFKCNSFSFLKKGQEAFSYTRN